MSDRINALALDQASVLATALMSARQVSKLNGVLPEVAAPESLVLAPARHYRFTTTLTVSLPTITADMDGTRISITQFSNACTVRFSIDGTDYEHVLTSSRNSSGGVTATFVAKYDATATACRWYLDRDIGRPLTTGYVAFPILKNELQIAPLQATIIGLIQDDDDDVDPTPLGDHTLWDVSRKAGDTKASALYVLNLLAAGNFIVSPFTIRTIAAGGAGDFAMDVNKYAIVYAYHDPVTGYFKNNTATGNIKTVYGSTDNNNRMPWGFIAYQIP